MIKKMITAPCHLNNEEYLTLWYHDTENGVQIWVQTSTDVTSPKWQRCGDCFERVVICPHDMPDMTNFIRQLIAEQE